MYKSSLIVLLTLFTHSVFCQLPQGEDGSIFFEDVVSFDTINSTADMFNHLKEWFVTDISKFQRSNSEKNYTGTNAWLGTPKSNFATIDALYTNDNPLKLADIDQNKLVGTVTNKYTGGTMGCIRVLYLEYDIIIRIRDGRLKYEITNFRYTHYNQASAIQSQVYGFKDQGPCKSKGGLEELLLCDKCANEFVNFKNYLNSDTKRLISLFNSHVESLDASVEDDW